jgi:hypothetical protein
MGPKVPIHMNNCPVCGAKILLVGVESDPGSNDQDVVTYLCPGCQAYQTIQVLSSTTYELYIEPDLDRSD